jgi:hypothetical protein
MKHDDLDYISTVYDIDKIAKKIEEDDRQVIYIILGSIGTILAIIATFLIL